MMLPIVLLARGLAASMPRHLLGAARAVVRQRAVDLAARLVDRQPLRPVHLGGAEGVARLPALDDDLAGVGEAVGGDERALAVRSGSQRPLPSASKRRTYKVPWSRSSRLACAAVTAAPAGLTASRLTNL
jgi:hypothetical protein